MRAWLPLHALSTRVRGAARRSSHVLQSSARSLTALRRRLAPTAAPTEADVLRVGLEALRQFVPTASAVALFTLPPGVGGGAEDAASASWPDAGQPPTLCTSYHAPELPEAAREALRDALRRVTCGDPATSVARLCDAAYAGTLTGSLQALTRDDAESGGAEDEEWAATESSDWLDSTDTFSDWQAAREAGASGVRFMTLTIAPTAGLGRKPALAAVLIRFDAFARASLARPRPAGLRAGTRLRALVARACALLPPAAPRPPVSGASAVGLRRVCSALGDALLAHRSAAAAAALAHTTALARDIYPVHLVDRMKARHSVALSRSSSSGPLAALTAAALAAATLDATAATTATATTSAEAAARHMLCESHESVTVCFVDIVGWTRLAGEMTAEEAMALLDRLYQRFDTLSLAHGVYKARGEQGRLGVVLLAHVCCVHSADVMWMSCVCVCVCVVRGGISDRAGGDHWRLMCVAARAAQLMPTHPADSAPFFCIRRHGRVWHAADAAGPRRRCASLRAGPARGGDGDGGVPARAAQRRR
jgi:class 3 adenylate cyclase